MKIYILSSNKYAHVCSTTIAMLNKYWPDQDITLVGYEDILKLKDLPDDVEVVSLGNQNDFPSWSDALVPFFQKTPEDYFTLLFEDHILMNKVPLDKLEEIEEQFRLNTVQKAMIGGGNTLKFSTKLFNKGIIAINEKAQVLSNQPSSKFFNIEDIKYVWNSIHECQKEIQ